MLDERGYVYEDKEIGTKQAAVETLERVMAAADTAGSTGDDGEGESVRKALFTKPSNGAKRRPELMRQLQELEESEAAARKRPRQATTETTTETDEAAIEPNRQRGGRRNDDTEMNM